MISEFPLFWFTTLGGVAAGAYAISALFSGVEKEAKRPWLFPLVCVALLGIGLLGVLFHLGRPLRVFNALANPASMITQEAYWAIPFGVLMFIDLVLLWFKGTSPRVVRILGAVAALGLMFVMGNLYFTSYGNPAWATWTTLPLFIVGDLAMGGAFYAAFYSAVYKKQMFYVLQLVLQALFIFAVVGVAVTFNANGHDVFPFAVSAVVAAGAIAFTFLAQKAVLGAPESGAKMLGLTAPQVAWLVFFWLFVAVVVARYFFYAASII